MRCHTILSSMAVAMASVTAVSSMAFLPGIASAIEPFTAARAILEARCMACHGGDRQESGLRLDSRAGLAAGGDFGRVITPGKSRESELVRRVRSIDPDERMPPEGDPLSADEIAELASWVDAGAPWADDGSPVTVGHDERLDHWAWQPLETVSVPDPVESFSALPGVEADRNEIDRFVRAKLHEQGLEPSAAADRTTLIRRLSFDLIGLPPMPEEIESFVADSSPDAYEKLVDRLLASPRYGERWARHWLDVVHYGDTHGYDKDKPRPNAWPYRDYVIRAFNDDKPYARFVEEQIAGDVLYPETRDGNEAIGFIAAGPWDFIGHREVPETKTDGKIARHLDRDDMVANTIGTFTSVTVQCAQCHAHKFDPVSQEDYYSLQAVFAAIDRDDRTFDIDPDVATRRRELVATRARHVAAKQAIEQAANRADDVGFSAADHGIAEADAALAALPEPSVVYAGASLVRSGQPRPIFLLSRGDVLAATHEVGSGTLSLIDGLPARFDLPAGHAEGARREALAKWLTDPRNPLVWRSIVNRVWQHHFGRGIVATPDDFGLMGAAPSHPQLLEWLAVDFRDGCGSLKRLHRRIVTSATYRQRSTSRMNEVEVDADNRFLWRQQRRRLEAEAIRDAVLAVSGTLDLTMGGPGWQDFVIEHPEHSPHYRYELADPTDRTTWRRGVYRFIVRSQTQPFMTCLDCADPSMRVATRNESTSPLQALTLLNNGFMVVQADMCAQHVMREAGDDVMAQVAFAFRSSLGREPDDDEAAVLVDLTRHHGLATTCRTLFNLNEFCYVD